MGETAEGLLHAFALGIEPAEGDFFVALAVLSHQHVLVIAVFEIAQNDGACAVECSGLEQLGDHAVDAIPGFPQVFEEKQFALR